MSFKLKKSNLNFNVYAVETKPTAAGTENDIAIITSVPMPNWIMSPDKPSGIPRSDGDVWIQYSVSGDTFNALKKNSMMIATIAAWQYVDGAWDSVEAASYQDGAWKDWIIVLWNASENYENYGVLGNNGFYITRNSYREGSLSKNVNGMVLNSNYGDNIVFASHDDIIDFAGLSKLTVTWDGGDTYENYQGIGIYANNNPSANTEALVYYHKDNTNAETVTFDISSVTEKGYIVLTAYNGDLIFTEIELN